MPRGFYRLDKSEYTRLTAPDEDGVPGVIPDVVVIGGTGAKIYLHAARYPHAWLEAEVPKAKLKPLGDSWGQLHRNVPKPTRARFFRVTAEGDEQDPEGGAGAMRRVRREVRADAVPLGFKVKSGMRISHAFGARESVKAQRQLDQELGQAAEV